MLRGKRLLQGLTVAALAGFAISLPGVAHAATESISGTVNSSGWTNYSTIRVTTQSVVNFDPTNTLLAPDGDTYLGIRLLNAGGTVVITTPVEWVNSSNNRTLISGIASGTSFRMSACCDQNSGDVQWGGTLVY